MSKEQVQPLVIEQVFDALITVLEAIGGLLGGVIDQAIDALITVLEAIRDLLGVL